MNVIEQTRPMTPERIKALRKSLGLSQEEFSREIGCTVASLSRWERSVRAPTPIFVRILESIEREATNTQRSE